jgi:hypothetical protein
MSENTNTSRRKWIILIAGIVVIACLGVIFVTGYVVYIGYQFAGITPCDTFTYDFLLVSLPPSANVLDESCAESLNPTYNVTFVMSPDDLAPFQQQDPVSNIAEWRSDASNSFLSEESWQHIREGLQKEGAQLQTLQYGEFGNGSILLYVLIDESDDQQYFVRYSASYVD